MTPFHSARRIRKVEAHELRIVRRNAWSALSTIPIVRPWLILESSADTGSRELRISVA
jgi:hypothetical protein